MFQHGEHNPVKTDSGLDRRLLIEQIRYIETVQPLDCENEDECSDQSAHREFEQRLLERALCLVRRHALAAALGRAARLARYAKFIALLLAALLGALGAAYAITGIHSINIYWLLLVLLGFNFFSMLLWLTGISLNLEGLTAGLLARLTSWLPLHLDNRSQAGSQLSAQLNRQADHAWLTSNFSGKLGKWQFSSLTHQLWLVYLLSGLLSLILLLLVRQYDFVWGTTLLPDSAFVKLTEMMSAPLQALGFTTPTPDQVQQSQIGMLQITAAEHRYRWAQFLLGALLCFGILPRFLLWIWSMLMLHRARQHFAIDLYLPYYISLRQQLMPLASHGQIIDADSAAPVEQQAVAETVVPHPVAQALPEETLWVAIEIGTELRWPPRPVPRVNDLGQVTDRESLNRVLQQLQSRKKPAVAVAVSPARAPDRGVQRTVASLLANSSQCWLVLLQQRSAEAVSAARLAAWYRLAEACKVPADHVISMSLD